MTKQSKPSGQYRFKRHDNIGANDAEDDEQFLRDCFEDSGDIAVLLDCTNPKRIVLGRTGAGKTALLLELRKRSEFVINLKPEHLSLNFLTNSTILPYLSSLGINLDPFYKLLWRHVFAVTIIQHRVDIVDGTRQRSFIEQIKEYFDSKESKARKQIESKRTHKALEYIERWGDRFFEDVEYRTKEVVQRFENEVRKGVQNEVGGSIAFPVGPLSVQATSGTRGGQQVADSTALEVTQEVINRAQNVVNAIQVQELGGILDLLDEVLQDSQKPCYITIDQLDEPWAGDDLRLRLLKGLVDTVREFRKVHNAKVIIALRVDLLEELFRLTRTEAGFQEDKFRSLCLPLRWTRQQLESLLNRRVAKLVRDAYTSYEPTIADILPDSIAFGRKRRVRPLDYILDRTWDRPRDAIEFLNACIAKSEGKATVSKDAVLEAEGEYSRRMLRAIATEWHADYPTLPDALRALLTNRPAHFRLAEISDEVLDEWSLAIAASDQPRNGELNALATRYQLNEVTIGELRREIASVFYKTGCVGLKTDAFAETRWATSEAYSVSTAEIDDSTRISIHPGLSRVLGVREIVSSSG